MHDKEFIEQVFELAFGDDAISKGYSKEEVLERISIYSELSLRYEDLMVGFQ